MSTRKPFIIVAAVLVLTAVSSKKSFAQAFGVELQANMQQASGGMAGAGIARPQDVQSALALNPATLAQKKGTQVGFSGSWVEPTIVLNQETPIGPGPGIIQPFTQKSNRPGSIVGNIGVSQDFTALGIPVTAGMGLLTASGLGVDYRESVASNGTTAELVVISTSMGVGAQLTDRLAAGIGLDVATTSMDGIFTGVSAATPDYNIRGKFGLTYDVNPCTTVGGYWKTEQSHRFEDFVRFGGIGTPFEDLSLELPNIYGVGVANNALLDGRLLVAVDVSYLQWSETDLFGAIWDDQFTVQTGLQLTGKRGIKYRIGYTWAEDATADVLANDIGGISPQAGVDYIQALFPNINEHRFSLGLGIPNVLPGVDVDLFRRRYV